MIIRMKFHHFEIHDQLTNAASLICHKRQPNKSTANLYLESEDLSREEKNIH